MFTADEGVRGGKIIPLKKMVDEALEGCKCVRRVYVYKRTGADVPMKIERDVVLDEVSGIVIQSPPPLLPNNGVNLTNACTLFPLNQHDTIDYEEEAKWFSTAGRH